MTPFHLEASEAFLDELRGLIMPDGKAAFKGGLAPLNWVWDLNIRCVTRSGFDENEMKESLKKTNMTEEEIEECLDDLDLDSELAAETWTAVCLVASALCGVDFGRDAPDDYDTVIRCIQTDSRRRRLFSRRPVYDIPLILRQSAEALDYVLGQEAESELADEMRRSGKYNEFSDSLQTLKKTLLTAAAAADLK